MASAVEQSMPLFSRSHSSPDILSLPSFERPSPSPAASLHHPVLDWKTWADVPAFEVPSFNSNFELDTSVFANDKTLSPPPKPEPAPKDPEVPDRPPRKGAVARSRTVSIISRPRSWLSSSSKSTKCGASDERQARPPPLPVDDMPTVVPSKPRTSKSSDRSASTSATIASFARLSWSTSRSASPKTVPESAPPKPPPKHAKGPPERLQLITDAIPDTDSERPNHADAPDSVRPSKPVGHSVSYFAKMKPKTPAPAVKVHEGSESDNSCASSSTSFGNRPSNSDRTSASRSTCSDGNTDTPVTGLPTETAFLQHDPLWHSFKSLEADFKTFGTRATAQRVGLIKNVLAPFLRSSADHKAIKYLKLEHVDRRASVLNKWWAAILDMLFDRAQHAVPGVDRPILLDAATLLMMRPEWRQATTYFQLLAERSPAERVRARSWTSASQSTDGSRHSALLMESADHNVRSMFVSNLVRQMAYVVEKMSVRHAPLSLVNLAGKTCAYAFFFAPGVADILVRLWGLTPELMFRTSDVFHLPRKDGGESDDIAALFPPRWGLWAGHRRERRGTC